MTSNSFPANVHIQSLRPVSFKVRIRRLLKDVLTAMGLLVVYVQGRRILHIFLVLPLQIMAAAGRCYTDFLWRVKPGFDLPRDYLYREVSSLKTTVICGNSTKITYYTPNAICQYRADSFLTKEPETLEWMDEFGQGGVLYDIGANVGLYTVYYAKTKNAPVYAFEPSVFNLSLLVKNINANQIQDKVKVVCNPLTSEPQFADFKLPSTNEGGALNGFGVDYGHDGEPLKTTVSYKTLGFSLDHLLEIGALTEKPRLVKLDVDGIEHLILDGARKTLSDPKCQSVLVEINEKFELQSIKVKEILMSCGFVLKYKKRAPMFDSLGSDFGTYNHIWVKKTAST